MLIKIKYHRIGKCTDPNCSKFICGPMTNNSGRIFEVGGKDVIRNTPLKFLIEGYIYSPCMYEIISGKTPKFTSYIFNLSYEI